MSITRLKMITQEAKIYKYFILQKNEEKKDTQTSAATIKLYRHSSHDKRSWLANDYMH